MALHHGLLKGGFSLPICEKHFHDHDETWLILKGEGTSYWVDHAGVRTEFLLREGDVWMIPAGYEHGSDGFPDIGRNNEDFTIAVFNGTEPPGSHKPGHYYVEREGYIPTLELKKNPTDRYQPRLDLPVKMKAFLFIEKGKTAIIDEDTPGCPPGHVLCQTLYTGLTNGTERNILMGGNYGGSWPSRVGYQNVGRVLKVGLGVKDYAVGDLIFSGDFLNHRQYFAAPTGPNALIIKVPETVLAQEAALFGIASVGLHDVRRADVKLGERVLVIGAGPIGQLTAQAARLCGAIVTVCDLNPERLAIAEQLGAHKVIVPDENWDNIKANGPYDCVFEDSGAKVLDRIFGAQWGQGILKERSRVVIIAGRDRVDYNFNAGQSYEVSLYQAGHFVADDLRQVCRLTAEKALHFGPILQDVVPYTDAVAVYDRLRETPSSLFGVVFDWNVSAEGDNE